MSALTVNKNGEVLADIQIQAQTLEGKNIFVSCFFNLDSAMTLKAPHTTFM